MPVYSLDRGRKEGAEEGVNEVTAQGSSVMAAGISRLSVTLQPCAWGFHRDAVTHQASAEASLGYTA